MANRNRNTFPDAGGNGDPLPGRPFSAFPAPGTLGGGMTQAQANLLANGLYVLTWLKDQDRHSVAAVGRDAAGNAWFAPSDWTVVPSRDWTQVVQVTLLFTREMGAALKIADWDTAARVEAAYPGGVDRTAFPPV